MRKINWTAVITYLIVVGISTIVGWWLIKVLYFMYLMLKVFISTL